VVKNFDHGEDYTPWAFWEYQWGILKPFLKKNWEGTWTGSRNILVKTIQSLNCPRWGMKCG
jgi:hypothetical protein